MMPEKLPTPEVVRPGLHFFMDTRGPAFKKMGFRPMATRLFLAIFTAVTLCSCASVSVRKVERISKNPPSRVPEKIFVRPFTFREPGLRVDRSGERLEQFKYDLQERFTRSLVRRLPRYVAPAEAVAATAPLPRGNYWVIDGRFDRVFQGSRLLRSVVGFGFGGTKMDTSVVISDLSGKKPRQFLLIETTGGSNASPGAIGTAAYFFSGVTALGSAANLVEGARSGVTFDTLRTTREVAATLSEYVREEGGTPVNATAAPKRLGQVREWPFGPRRAKQGTVTVTSAQ
jgi:hypothetical protein